MTQLFAKLIIVLAASQWIYAEFLLYHPDADVWAKRAMQVLSVPTHDKWTNPRVVPFKRALKEILGEPRAIQIHTARVRLTDIETALDLLPVSAEHSGNKDPPHVALDAPYVDLFDQGSEGRPFLWGAEIFESESYKTAYFRDKI